MSRVRPATVFVHVLHLEHRDSLQKGEFRNIAGAELHKTEEDVRKKSTGAPSVRLALIALQNIIQQGGRSLDTKGADGFTELQRFFLADANAECTEFRPEMMGSSILSNPHSWNQYRVNNVIANMPEFTKAFACAQRYFL